MTRQASSAELTARTEQLKADIETSCQDCACELIEIIEDELSKDDGKRDFSTDIPHFVSSWNHKNQSEDPEFKAANVDRVNQIIFEYLGERIQNENIKGITNNFREGLHAIG